MHQQFNPVLIELQLREQVKIDTSNLDTVATNGATTFSFQVRVFLCVYRYVLENPRSFAGLFDNSWSPNILLNLLYWLQIDLRQSNTVQKTQIEIAYDSGVGKKYASCLSLTFTATHI
jgi:hypothetical protein